MKARYRFNRSELSGAFADLGLLIPLEAGLIAVNGLNPTSTLLGVGIVYIAAGWYFRFPMPVQPLKALAAIALARELDGDVIAAGALLMSICLFALAVSGLVDRLYAIVPTPVVRGIQLGLAYVLIRGALNMLEKPLATDAIAPSISLGGSSVAVMVLISPFAIVALLLLLRRQFVPASLVVLAIGGAVGVYLGRWQGGGLGPAPISAGLPSMEAFETAALVLLTAQLPLTLANSVIATSDAARQYFPDASDRATPRRLSLSIAAANLWAGFFGGLPTCHGSGGLTAHYKFGARTPMATAILGIILILVALVFGNAAQSIRTLIPLPFFGILLMLVGIQHIALAARVDRRSDFWFIGLAGALAAVFDGNLAYAAIVTAGAYWLVQLLTRLRASMQARPSRAYRMGG